MAGARESNQSEFRPFVDFRFVDVFGRFPSHVGGAIAIGKRGAAGEVLPEAAFESEEVFGVDAKAGSIPKLGTQILVLEVDQFPDRGRDGKDNLVRLGRARASCISETFAFVSSAQSRPARPVR